MARHRTVERTAPPRVSVTDMDLLSRLDGYRFPAMSASIPGILGARYAAIVLVEDDYLWFRSRVGFTEPATSRAGSLWDLAMAGDEPFVVEDLAADARFGAPVEVGGSPVRFFASCALRAADGRRIGVLCVADPEPLAFDSGKVNTLAGFVTWIQMELVAIADVDRAADVQRALLPKDPPPLEGYEVAGACVAAKGVAGDFYDWYPIEGGAAFTLADVMGKGLGAGIIAATIRATIRSAMRKRKVATGIQRAADVLRYDLRDSGTFVTLFHARLRAADGRLTFVDAGHGLSIIVEAEGTAYRLATEDFPVGAAFEGYGWTPERVMLSEGATLVSFSDGVLDLYDGSLESIERVAEIVRRSATAQDVVDEIARLARRDEAPDDVTVFAVRRNGGMNE
jgi:hypothetical protein